MRQNVRAWSSEKKAEPCQRKNWPRFPPNGSHRRKLMIAKSGYTLGGQSLIMKKMFANSSPMIRRVGWLVSCFTTQCTATEKYLATRQIFPGAMKGGSDAWPPP